MKKIHQLEGVRGIGAMIVFVCHFQIVFFPQFYNIVSTSFKIFLPANLSNFIIYFIDLSIIGNMFLHIFWALSAYVIFKKFFEYNTKGEGLLASVVKRYFRLMIPCAVSIFFSYFLFKAGLIYVRAIHITVLQQNLYAFPPSFLHAIKNSIWNTFFDYDFYNSYNGPLWTIEREFYGSIFCFALFGVIGTIKNRSFFYLAIFICALALKMYWLNSFLFGYYLCDYDFSTKGNVNLLYRLVDKINNMIISHQLVTVLLFSVVFVAVKYIPYHIPDTVDLVNSVLSISVILIALRIDLVAKVMSVPILSKLGQISFGLYLLHWPFMCAFTSWYYLTFDHTTYLHIAVLFVLTLTFSLILAWIFYRFVDITSIKWSGKIARYITKITTDEIPVIQNIKAELIKQP